MQEDEEIIARCSSTFLELNTGVMRPLSTFSGIFTENNFSITEKTFLLRPGERPANINNQNADKSKCPVHIIFDKSPEF